MIPRLGLSDVTLYIFRFNLRAKLSFPTLLFLDVIYNSANPNFCALAPPLGAVHEVHTSELWKKRQRIISLADEKKKETGVDSFLSQTEDEEEN